MYRYIYVICIFFCWQNLYAQTELSGFWLVDFQKTIDMMSEGNRKEYDSLREEQRNRLFENFSTRTFLFKDSGAVEISWIASGNKGSVAGSWILKGSELSIIYAKGYKSVYSIQTMEEDSLILTMKTSPGIFTKLFLSRGK
ncbi:hypothetical protein SAMN05660236_0729 [Ohtaekwangia koreensis]|uniref:Lipocalin-like domain-containing protein n=1 Tax=Ohtaekwangia koreensis TaxID=688867 RepID=A0A1T5J4E6_9BACT|nr:hypothetical protein SAMN05660236_0729 [Ohtaekwangia koreensis]